MYINQVSSNYLNSFNCIYRQHTDGHGSIDLGGEADQEYRYVPSLRRYKQKKYSKNYDQSIPYPILELNALRKNHRYPLKYNMKYFKLKKNWLLAKQAIAKFGQVNE